jgi:hypothetical protein
LAIIVGLIVVWAASVLTYDRWSAAKARRHFRQVFAPEGKDLLLVYSNSPHWQAYVEQTWLPRWGKRAVILNWSERSRWDQRAPEVRLFRSVAGNREFNPLGVVILRSGELAVVRFWQAFRDYKHGKDRLLRAAEAELEQQLSSASLDAS